MCHLTLGEADKQVSQYEGAGYNSYRRSVARALAWLAAYPWALCGELADSPRALHDHGSMKLTRRLRPANRALASATLTCILGCTPTPADEIHDAMVAVAAQGEGSQLSLDSIAPGRWARLFIIGLYTHETQIETCTGLQLRGRQLHGIGMLDNRHLIIVESDRGRVSTRSLSRRDVEIAAEGSSAGYLHPGAAFVVARSPSGNELRPASTPAIDCRPSRMLRQESS
jgi:hypothetical protein